MDEEEKEGDDTIDPSQIESRITTTSLFIKINDRILTNKVGISNMIRFTITILEKKERKQFTMT